MAGFADSEEAPGARRDGLPILVHDIRNNPGNTLPCKPGQHRFAEHRGNHMHAGLGLPPGVNNRTAFFAYFMIIPFEGFRLSGSPNRPEESAAYSGYIYSAIPRRVS